MGQTISIQNINFRNLQGFISDSNPNPNRYIINTLPINEQSCIIPNTVKYSDEESLFNNLIKNRRTNDVEIIVYGKHYGDITVSQKCKHLIQLGFSKIFVYEGGLFEWFLLHEICGEKSFPTTSKIIDLWKYTPPGIVTYSTDIVISN